LSAETCDLISYTLESSNVNENSINNPANTSLKWVESA